jgi:hypothetical protein
MSSEIGSATQWVFDLKVSLSCGLLIPDRKFTDQALNRFFNPYQNNFICQLLSYSPILRHEPLHDELRQRQCQSYPAGKCPQNRQYAHPAFYSQRGTSPQKIMIIYPFSRGLKKYFDKQPYLLSSLPKKPTERSVVLPGKWKEVLSAWDNHFRNLTVRSH